MITIPFRTPRLYPVFRVPDRIVMPRFTQNGASARAWSMDIRRILADNAILDRERLAQADIRNVEQTAQGVLVDIELPPPIDPGNLCLEI